ncbi:unnamed protein product, partial [Cyprideis torosa]
MPDSSQKSFESWKTSSTSGIGTRFLSLYAAKMSDAGRTKIVNGRNAEKEIPYLVLVEFKHTEIDSICAGGIWDESWILTAAHCIEEKLDSYVVTAGELDTRVRGHEQMRQVDFAVKHPHYVSALNGHDIGLLRLSEPLKFNEYVSALQYDPNPDSPYMGERCTVAGWGVVVDGNDRRFPDVLQITTQVVQNQSFCAQQYLSTGVSFSSDIMFCAGDLHGKTDTCDGDSGSPLVMEGSNVIVGLTSFGTDSCAMIGYPAVYTRVSAYLYWIKETINDFESTSCKSEADLKITALNMNLHYFTLFLTTSVASTVFGSAIADVPAEWPWNESSEPTNPSSTLAPEATDFTTTAPTLTNSLSPNASSDASSDTTDISGITTPYAVTSRAFTHLSDFTESVSDSSEVNVLETKVPYDGDSSATGSPETKAPDDDDSSVTGSPETKAPDDDDSSVTGSPETKAPDDDDSSVTGSPETKAPYD